MCKWTGHPNDRRFQRHCRRRWDHVLDHYNPWLYLAGIVGALALLDAVFIVPLLLRPIVAVGLISSRRRLGYEINSGDSRWLQSTLCHQSRQRQRIDDMY
jgi:hypothetical protein